MKTKTAKTVLLFMAFAVVFGNFAMAEEEQKVRRLAPCKDDIAKFCADIPRGQHKIRPCLESNKDKLTAECKAALAVPKPSDGK